MPREYTGTAEPAPAKGSPQERGTGQLVLLSKLVLYKLYTLVRIGHDLKLETPLTRRGVARILCEAIARPGRTKGLPAPNTFGKNLFNPMPHQVFVTDAYLSIAPDKVLQRMKKGRRRSMLQRAQDQHLSDDEIRDIAASVIAARLSGWRNRLRPPQPCGEEGAEGVAAPPPAASFGGPPINGGHDNSAQHHGGAAYWRQRTQVAMGDSLVAAGSWASLLRGAPTWGG